jgi:streptogrisin D
MVANRARSVTNVTTIHSFRPLGWIARHRLGTGVVLAALLLGVVTVPAYAGIDMATARSAFAAIDALPPTPNTAWGLDPTGDHVVLTVSDAAPGVGALRLLDLAQRLGGLVRVVHTRAPLSEQQLLGGDGINDGRIVCSAGFNVIRGFQQYVLTAGHCTAGLPHWTGIGPAVVSVFPVSDYGIVRNDLNDDAPGAIDRFDGTAQPITAAGDATVGEQVCASGVTTGVTCGQVTAVDQTVDYGNGDVVRGLIQTTVHTDHGDSGGPLFDGATGLGMVSGGDGTTDFFQPLAPVLAAYHLDLV